MPQVIFKDIGLVSYRQAWDLQQRLLDELVERKKLNRLRRERGEALEALWHYLLFCEHNPVYTLGRSGSESNLLADEETLRDKGIEFFRINRGGDITFHGPGQIVGYPILDLDDFFTDVHRYVRTLEEAIILTLADYGIAATRIPEYTGVWLPATDALPDRKICAIGVHLSRWVTMHGFAFNVQTDLSYFRHIIPCGIPSENKAVTSLSLELGRTVDMKGVKTLLLGHLAALFDFVIAPQPEAGPPILTL